MFAAIPFPDIDPVAFYIFTRPVYWYALAYVAGLLFAAWYIKRIVTFPKLWGATRPTLTAEQVDDVFLWFLGGVIIGGRLGYVLLYKPLEYLQNPIEIFKPWDGGMSFHGGFLGVMFACIIWGRRNGVDWIRQLDLGAAATPVGLGLGRIANFINAELWGAPTDVSWGVIFPGQSVARHPSQIYEAILEGLLLFIAVRIATHSFGMLQRRGFASGIFAFGYGASRIFVEFFREPDRHIGYIFGPITMGMVYSMPLVIVGIWLLWRARRPA
jgi:phosphatidylglycerol---prolipoprotein diacylglyceryl transferase